MDGMGGVDEVRCETMFTHFFCLIWGQMKMKERGI